MSESIDIEKTKTIYGTFFSLRNDLITEQLKAYSAHTRNELAMIRSLVGEGDNIIDIGAHIGTFSIPFAVFNQGKGKVFSFEANPDNYNLLIRNISENHLDKIIIPTHAVVSSEDMTRFDMSLPGGGNSGEYYFLPSTNRLIGEVDVINIDSWHKRMGEMDIRLIKVDVEGAEESVLLTCQELIGKYKPILYIEICRSHLDRFNSSVGDIEEILGKHGYHYFRNIGPRNSANDNFRIARMNSINEGGPFFDVLAVHPSDDRYPREAEKEWAGDK